MRREAVLPVVKLREPTPAMIERREAMGRDDRDPKVRDAAKRAASHHRDQMTDCQVGV